jgi:hypothetical protein
MKNTKQNRIIFEVVSWLLGIAGVLLIRQLCLHFGMNKRNANGIAFIVFWSMTFLLGISRHLLPIFKKNATKPDGSSYTKKDKVIGVVIAVLTVFVLAVMCIAADAIAAE